MTLPINAKKMMKSNNLIICFNVFTKMIKLIYQSFYLLRKVIKLMRETEYTLEIVCTKNASCKYSFALMIIKRFERIKLFS